MDANATDLQVEDPVDECLFNLLVEVADQQSKLDCLLATVARLSAQMPEESQTQITFRLPADEGPARNLWINAGLPEEFTEEELGDALRRVEVYILAQPNYMEIIGPQGWLSFIYTLFEHSLAKFDLDDRQLGE